MSHLPNPDPRHTTQKQCRQANQHSYHDGDRISNYLTDPYHRVRREVAAGMLRAAHLGERPVLELGCGPHSMLAAGQLPTRLVLADLAVGPLIRAHRAVGASTTPGDTATTPGPAPPVLPVCLDATRTLPFRSGTFGAVLMGDLIEHVYDPVALLRECHRVLMRDGQLVLTTPNLAALQDRAVFLAGNAPRQVNPLHPYLRLHIRPFTASLLRQVLRRAGFGQLRIRSNYVGWQLPGGRWIASRILARVLPGLGGSLICSARSR
jgi:SAM-dependent methyltransferase